MIEFSGTFSASSRQRHLKWQVSPRLRKPRSTQQKREQESKYVWRMEKTCAAHRDAIGNAASYLQLIISVN